jgi:glucose/arabinose dehydrogenase
MKFSFFPSLLGAGLLIFVSCSGNTASSGQSKEQVHADDSLPLPYATKSAVNFSKVIGWPEDVTPKAPEGFTVSLFAGGLNNPRWIYVAPNGDILVAEARTGRSGVKKAVAKITGQSASQNQNDSESGNRIIMFRDTDNDGIPDLTSIFLSDLNQPFGMLIIGSSFYVANTDGLYQYPYKTGRKENC